MNFQEAMDVSMKGPVWISFYYGRVERGSLYRDVNSGFWYFIKNWKSFIENGRSIDNEVMRENAELVYLEMIEVCDGPLNKIEDGEGSVVVTDYDETILVVIGAGASYDFDGSTKEKRFKLPLTKDIFSEEHSSVLNQYEGASRLAHSLVEIQDLETFFQRKWNMVARSYNLDLMKKLLSAQYFMQELFWKYSLLAEFIKPNFYAALIEQMSDYVALKQGRVKFLVVNFNYDTIFEDQLLKMKGYRFENIDHYDDPSRDILVFKLHGSSNWCRYRKDKGQYQDFVKSSIMANTIENRLLNMNDFNSEFEPRIDIMNEEKKLAIKDARNKGLISKLRTLVGRSLEIPELELKFNREYYPHMLIPFRDKDEFIIPKSQEGRLETMLEKCKRGYAIGWKGNEKRFIDLLEGRTLKMSWITGTNGQKEILAGEAKRLVKCRHTYYTDGFAHCMKYVNSNMDNMFEGENGIGINHG